MTATTGPVAPVAQTLGGDTIPTTPEVGEVLEALNDLWEIYNAKDRVDPGKLIAVEDQVVELLEHHIGGFRP